jgi:type I restriction enzyme, S subunit
VDTLIGSVPDDWRVCVLGDCCDIRPGPSGSVLKTSDYVLDGIPVVRAENVGDDIVPDATRTVSAETVGRLERYRLRPGDVLLVRIGVTTRFATASLEHDGWVLGGSCLLLRVLSNVSPEGGLAPGYLACYLAQPAVQGWLADQTRRGVRSTLRASTVSNMPLVVPPKTVQETVTTTAQAIDAKIRAHEEVIRASKALRGLLLPQLLTGQAVPW